MKPLVDALAECCRRLSKVRGQSRRSQYRAVGAGLAMLGSGCAPALVASFSANPAAPYGASVLCIGVLLPLSRLMANAFANRTDLTDSEFPVPKDIALEQIARDFEDAIERIRSLPIPREQKDPLFQKAYVDNERRLAQFRGDTQRTPRRKPKAPVLTVVRSNIDPDTQAS